MAGGRPDIKFQPVASGSRSEDGDNPPKKFTRQRNACSECQAVKSRCVRTLGEGKPCQKCSRSGRPCVVPERKLGRKPGSVNKFTELNRALRRAQEASEQLGKQARRLEGDAPLLPPQLLQNLLGLASLPGLADSVSAPSTAEQLRSALAALPASLSAQAMHPPLAAPQLPPAQAPLSSLSSTLPPLSTHLPPRPASDMLSMYTNVFQQTDESPSHLSASGSVPSTAPTEAPASEAFKNPLSLLSEASEATATNTSPRLGGALNASMQGTPLSLQDLGMEGEKGAHDSGLDHLFGNLTMDASVLKLEHGAYYKTRSETRLETDDPLLDPIGSGVMTIEEADVLLAFFHRELHPITLALDPALCTLDFIRKTSPLLLTAVCACAAQFSPAANAGMAMRLTRHFDMLADVVKTRGYKSASIVHGFLLGSRYPKAAAHISEEKTWSHCTTAASIGIELGLHSTFGDPNDTHATYTPSNAELEACPAGLSREDARQRLLRHAERAWLHCFLTGTGLASTLGRPWISRWDEFVPSKVVAWQHSTCSLPEDAHSSAIVLLRRLVHCDIGPLLPAFFTTTSTALADDNYFLVKRKIEATFSAWHREWLHSEPNVKEYLRTPLYQPYLVLLYRHHLVLAYSLVLRVYQGPNLSAALVDCLRVALDVARLIVKEGEEGGALRLIGNNIASMCLHSAVCALKALALLKPTDPEVCKSVMGLLGRMSRTLEDAGATPPWRSGTMAMAGSHLRALLLTQGSSLLPLQAPQSDEMDLSGYDTSAFLLHHDDGHPWTLPFATDSYGRFDLFSQGFGFSEQTYPGMLSMPGSPYNEL